MQIKDIIILKGDAVNKCLMKSIHHIIYALITQKNVQYILQCQINLKIKSNLNWINKTNINKIIKNVLIFPDKLSWVPHTCYVGKTQCKPYFGSCLQYKEHKECCCDKALAEQCKKNN